MQEISSLSPLFFLYSHFLSSPCSSLLSISLFSNFILSRLLSLFSPLFCLSSSLLSISSYFLSPLPPPFPSPFFCLSSSLSYFLPSLIYPCLISFSSILYFPSSLPPPFSLFPLSFLFSLVSYISFLLSPLSSHFLSSLPPSSPLLFSPLLSAYSDREGRDRSINLHTQIFC